MQKCCAGTLKEIQYALLHYGGMSAKGKPNASSCIHSQLPSSLGRSKTLKSAAKDSRPWVPEKVVSKLDWSHSAVEKNLLLTITGFWASFGLVFFLPLYRSPARSGRSFK